MTINPAAAETMFNALKTIALTTKTSEVLKALDPMAYAQVIAAIEAAESKPEVELVIEVSYNGTEDPDALFTAYADFRDIFGDDLANYNMRDDLANNWERETYILADPELSAFYAYFQTQAGADEFVEFVKDLVPDNVTVIADFAF